MFEDRQQHQTFVISAALLCIVGAVMITVALFQMYLSEEPGYGPIQLSGCGALFFFLGIVVGAYIKRRMTF